MRAHRATSPDVPSFLHYYTEGMPFRRYLEVSRNRDTAPSIRATCSRDVSFRVCWKQNRGGSWIRHSLNEYLERVGGHIGYVVVPEFRRQGYATAMLHLSLQIAREKCNGAHRVLVTGDDDNVGSIRTIEKNGGASRTSSVDRASTSRSAATGLTCG